MKFLLNIIIIVLTCSCAIPKQASVYYNNYSNSEFNNHNNINSKYYLGKSFDLYFYPGEINYVSDKKTYVTDSKWIIKSKSGENICESLSRIYLRNHNTSAPASGILHKIWVYENNNDAILAIEEMNSSWYNRSVQTIIFDLSESTWNSYIIEIPDNYVISEGKGEFIQSINSNGYITYNDPNFTSRVNLDKSVTKVKNHYSEMIVSDPFPPGNNW